jgi:threonine dehydratase
MTQLQEHDVHQLAHGDVKAATDRIAGRVRPVVLSPLDPGAVKTAPRDPLDDRSQQDCQVWLALEYMQHTGSFKARGAQNFIAAHREDGTLPDTGITIASGGNAGLACAWAARQQGITATVFLPTTAPAVKVAKLRGYGADVRLVGDQYADALAACEDFAAATGALASHAYADPFIAAGAGTLLEEIRQQVPDLDTIVVAVGGGGLFAGVATAGQHHGITTVAVEPEHCRALNAAIEAGHLVDVDLDSVAADSLGARRTWPAALAAAQSDLVHSVLVTDAQLIAARQILWDHRRIAVEHGTATALAAVLATEPPARPEHIAAGQYPRTARSYRPGSGEKVAVVLCGANTDPSDLVPPPVV